MSDLSIIRPGDTVLVRLSDTTTLKRADEIVAGLKECLPNCELVILSGVQGIDVYRPDPPAEGT